MKCFDCGAEMYEEYFEPDQGNDFYAIFKCNSCGGSAGVQWFGTVEDGSDGFQYSLF